MSWQPKITRHERRLYSALLLRKINCVANPKISGYYPDLHISGTNILIEVDGGVHRGAVARAKDRQRTYHLKQAGYRVLRFSNRQIEEELLNVLAQIEKAVARAQQGRSGFVFTAAQETYPGQAKRAREKAKQLNSEAKLNKKSRKR